MFGIRFFLKVCVNSPSLHLDIRAHGLVLAWSGVYLEFNGSGTPSTNLIAGHTSSIVLASKSFKDGVPLTNPIPPGPYFVDPFTAQIFQGEIVVLGFWLLADTICRVAWLLFNDEQQSFLYGTVPDGHGGFSQLSAHIDGAATESVAVPSRLYFSPTHKEPLAGARIAVKDIFDMKGLRTGCGNRAFYQFFPPKTQTAPSIQRLIDGGAIIVGKTKASQFANGETATDDWVDYHAPYNPRGDGYQDGSSSSTGSGTAIAAYPWLDYTVGSDTGGSMRGPAGANGAYGNRPSHGAVVLDDVMPLSPALDTAGIFARDAKSWQTAGLWWYENFTSVSLINVCHNRRLIAHGPDSVHTVSQDHLVSSGRVRQQLPHDPAEKWDRRCHVQ